LAEDPDRTAAWFEKSKQQSKQGRLAAAIGADQADKIQGKDLEVNPAQDRLPVE
jgi:hypothetical protein